MKVKLFTKQNPNYNVEPTHTELETEINGWLKKNPDIAVRHVQHSTAGSGPFLFCISVWYEETPAKTAS
ncbi:MAG: hypothetical protein ACO1QS_06800 [Verrucomicrobiota bacterium]